MCYNFKFPHADNITPLHSPDLHSFRPMAHVLPQENVVDSTGCDQIQGLQSGNHKIQYLGTVQ